MPAVIAILDVDADRCLCARCLLLDRRFPREGYQLALPISPGGRLDSAPVPDPDTPAAVTAGVSALVAAQSRQSARGHQPGAVHD